MDESKVSGLANERMESSSIKMEKPAGGMGSEVIPEVQFGASHV